MATSETPQITQLLLAWRQGDTTALDQLMPLVQDELRKLAHHFMAHERHDHVLQTTALINEAYLRLIDSSQVHWKSRAHFFAVAAQLMRRILVDTARERHSQKRGGEWIRVSFADVNIVLNQDSTLIALDEAPHTLAEMDLRKSEVVTMRYFGGLSVKETAAVLNVSPDTVMREWQLAKVWLYRELQNGVTDES